MAGERLCFNRFARLIILKKANRNQINLSVPENSLFKRFDCNAM
jgi:hypothetical protein